MCLTDLCVMAGSHFVASQIKRYSSICMCKLELIVTINSCLENIILDSNVVFMINESVVRLKIRNQNICIQQVSGV